MIEFNKKNARLWSIMGINPSIWSVGFADVLDSNPNVSVLTADLARFSGLERIASMYPDRFYNVGIAEQNMIGIAAGMAMEGFMPFVTTYAPFVTFRCADQIRHLISNKSLNVKIIGSSAGLTSGWSGSALLAISDIALMRSLPNVIILNPADCFEAIKMVVEMSRINAPVYLRVCGTTNLPIVYSEDYDFHIGKAVRLKYGERICLIGSGIGIVSETMKAAEIIDKELGIETSVVNMHTIKPLDTDILDELSSNHGLIVTIEEHNVIGGLGSAVAEYYSSKGKSPRLISLGIRDCLPKMGSRQYMLKSAGLDFESITECIVENYKEN